MLPLSIGISLAIISTVGLCLNGYIFLVLILTKQISPNNILLVHLSIIQSLLSVIFLIFSFPSIVHPGSWLASIEFTCILQGFLLILLHPLTLWTICGLNCDRFYAIAAPLHYSAIVTNKKVVGGLISGWIVIILLSIPPLMKVAPYKFSTNLGACVPNFATTQSHWYAVIFTVITLLVPGIVVIGCNIKVLMIARYHRHRIAAAIYEVTLSAQVTITHQRNPFFVPSVTAPSAGGPRFRSRSPISSVLQLVGSFVILYLPYYVSIVWDSMAATFYGPNVPDKYKTNSYVSMVSTVLLTCSTTVNGILYGLKSKTIRKSFQNYWRKKKTKNEINQEIQARTPSTCGSRRPSVSNLNFLTRPLLQRRLSETLIDLDRNGNGSGRPKIKRIASELTWRLTFAGLDSPTLPVRNKDIALAHTASCNTLQVPIIGTDEVISEADRELYNTVRNSFRAAKQTHGNPRKTLITIKSPMHIRTCNSQTGQRQATMTSRNSSTKLSTANSLLHKVLGLDGTTTSSSLSVSTSSATKRLNICSGSSSSNNNNNNNSGMQARIFSSPLKSPRILITRAMSDESDKTPSNPGTPGKQQILRQYASSSTLMERGIIVVANNPISENRCSEWKKQLNGSCILVNNSEEKSDTDSDNEIFGRLQRKEIQVIFSDSNREMNSCSNSTSVSDPSQRRYSSLEEGSGFSRGEFDLDSPGEEQLLLSWPTTRKKYSNKVKIYSGNVNNGGIFRPSPLFNDRSEEPEVIL